MRSPSRLVFLRHHALAAVASLLVVASLPAQAVGRLADVTIVDRDTGATLPVHYAKGEYWVAGRPGARYAIAVRNRVGGRLLAVPSVDGVNVLSGETAAWDQRGYVFSAYEHYQITGWRKSDSQVAAFEFSSIGQSYASRTGRPAHVGVIGVALFREQPAAPAPTVTPEPYSQRRESSSGSSGGASGNSLGRLREEPAPHAPAPAGPAAPAAAAAPPAPMADAAESAARSLPADSVAKPSALPSPKLGTAHGQRETSVVQHTTFTRLQDRPNEVISIRYDSRENLIASGVIRESVPRLPQPRAFPQSDAPSSSYVPDPS